MANTSFEVIYSKFLSKATDDMYLELSEQETQALLEELLIDALPWFEFPRVDVMAFDDELKEFDNELSQEEINIIATYMVVEWVGQQLANVENVRMKYSGQDFKFTSQANHLAKLVQLKKEYIQEGFHLQRLYKRRIKGKDGTIKPTLAEIMGVKNDY